MNENVIEIVCPKCALSTVATSLAEARSCPRCGSSLAVPDVGRPRATVDGAADVETAPPPAGADAGEAALIADLQEAFGLDASAPCHAGAHGLAACIGSSVAFARHLGSGTLPAGTSLGDFEILAELGRGGMGVVYRARQVSLGREVALKVLPGYARHGRLAVQRFKAEAQAAARLHHTNIVSIYAQGEHDGQFYYAMELVDGVGLDTVIHSRPDLLSSTRMRGGSSAGWELGERQHRVHKPDADVDAAPTPPLAGTAEPPAARWTRADYRHVAALMADVADALECAHRHGVIHRDIKPHNRLLGKNNRLHLTDFGLARLMDEPHLTVSGEIMGTPAYLSPEQVRGDSPAIDHHTDIYSLGVTLYEVITRHKPFDGQTREQIITGICTTEPVRPRRLDPHVPTDLETVCLRAMEKEPARRHATAALLAEDLRRFAEGRPILSRRVSRLERTAKWVRRHKALTAAAIATTAVVILASGLTWSVRSARHREGEQLLRQAYEQLAYFDYRTPGLEQSRIDRAQALGADANETRLVRALARISTTPWSESIQRLQEVLASDPTNLRAWYLLAWVQRENGQHADTKATFAQAEQRGPPTTADAWFFRGLALHWDDPSAAIESYHQANALRARGHEFYPQAMLHLARARNQQLYATRTLEPFPEADASLRQLIEHQYYGAYPYYLLSIANRLAAEIYDGSLGTRDDSQVVAEHYDQALKSARSGQTVDPADDRPITAEAECLESMGRYAEAIEARTRAIDIAATPHKRWEGYYYRWRLYYWTGEYGAALDDLAVCANFDSTSRFCAHVYPALVQAELGDMEQALTHARALASEAPGDAQAVLWSATCLRLLGRGEEADALLAERADTVEFGAGLLPPQTEEWVRMLYSCCSHGQPMSALEAFVEGAAAPWKLWGEAAFHSAAISLAEGNRTAALEGFGKAYRSFDGENRYTFHGKLVCRKIQQDSSWPPWVAVSYSDVPETGHDQHVVLPGKSESHGEEGEP